MWHAFLGKNETRPPSCINCEKKSYLKSCNPQSEPLHKPRDPLFFRKLCLETPKNLRVQNSKLVKSSEKPCQPCSPNANQRDLKEETLMSVLSAVRLTPHDEKFWSCIQVPLAQDNEFSSQICSQKIIVLISILLSLRIIWHNSWNHLRIKEKPWMPSSLRLFCLLLVQHLLSPATMNNACHYTDQFLHHTATNCIPYSLTTRIHPNKYKEQAGKIVHLEQLENICNFLSSFASFSSVFKGFITWRWTTTSELASQRFSNERNGPKLNVAHLVEMWP